jgi:predicted TPR repeat methyltransferase
MQNKKLKPGGDVPVDIFGRALYDYYKGRFQPPLLLHNKYGVPEEIPVEGYFFDESSFSEMEDFALSLCKGRTLDAGAAAGRHTLTLQSRGLNVTGLEISPGCCNLMRERGLKSVACADIFEWNEGVFDTIILMMNGIGLAGNVEGLKRLLNHFKVLLARGGQIIFDSSDVSYLYEHAPVPVRRYYGEIDYRYEYRQQTGDWFSWLYIDMEKMNEISLNSGWSMQVIYEDSDGTYLGRLKRAV